MRYSIVLPVFNESENIGPFCQRAMTELPAEFELLICYDHDADTTLSAFAALSAKPPHARLVKNNLGPGPRYAIEAGMRAAQAPVVVVMMADLSDDFAKVEEMVQRVEAGADVVCGSRYMKGGAQHGGPRLKKFLSRNAGRTLRWFAGLPVHDPTNSFKAYKKSFLDESKIESTAGFVLGLELTVKGHLAGKRVEEVPVTWTDRSAGASRFRLWKWLPHYMKWYFVALRGQRK